MENLSLFSVQKSKSLASELSVRTRATEKVSNSIKEARKIPWPSNYHICKEEKDLGRIARQIATAREFAFDCETTSLYWPTGQLLCISIAVNNDSYLINFGHQLLPRFSYDLVSKILAQYFCDDEYKKYGFNIKFDAHWIERFLGIKVGYLHFDGYIASWFEETDLIAGQRALKALAERYLGTDGRNYSTLFGNKQWGIIDPQVASYYACKDADLHLKLCKYYEQELEKYQPHKKLFYELDMPVLNMDFQVERDGFLMDQDYLEKELNGKLQGQLDELQEDLIKAGVPKEVNPASPDQLAEYLFDELKLPRIAGNSTAKAVLEILSDKHPVVPLLEDFRTTYKLKTSFVDSLSELLINSRVHPSIRTTGTATSRGAMESPNLQQMPSKIGPMIRQAFIAPPGYMFVSKDLKGQELRIMGHFCGKDSRLAKVAVQGTIYEEVASTFYHVPIDQLKKGDIRRDNGKKAWLAMQYGAQGTKIASIFNCPKSDADLFIKHLFNERFPEIGQYTKNTIGFSKKNGYIINILGRKRHLHYDKCTSKLQTMALERYAGNTPIQSSAAEQLKLGFLLCNRWLISKNYTTRAVLRIHDEIIFLVKIDEWSQEMDKMLDSIMVTALPMSIPFETTTELYVIKDGHSRWGIT